MQPESPRAARSGRISWRSRAIARTGWCLAWRGPIRLPQAGVNQSPGAGHATRPGSSKSRCPGPLLLSLDHLVERQRAALDLVHAVVGDRRVAGAVDAVGAEDALAVLRVEDLLEHLVTVVPLAARLLDRVEDERHRLVAVDGVRIRVRVARIRLLEVREELLALRR